MDSTDRFKVFSEVARLWGPSQPSTQVVEQIMKDYEVDVFEALLILLYLRKGHLVTKRSVPNSKLNLMWIVNHEPTG